MWFIGLAFAHDPQPGPFLPSVTPGVEEVDVGFWLGANSLSFARGNSVRNGARAMVRRKRIAAGAFVGLTDDLTSVDDVEATAWLGFSMISNERLRVQVYGEVGTLLRPGMSFAWTLPGGIGDKGFIVDGSWGPAFFTANLFRETWAGPFSVDDSMPELGFSMALHPRGTQTLRLGMTGLIPTLTYRLDMRREGRFGFLLENSVGTNGVGGIFTLTLGGNFGARRTL